jgi:hypothetical protein
MLGPRALVVGIGTVTPSWSSGSASTTAFLVSRSDTRAALPGLLLLRSQFRTMFMGFGPLPFSPRLALSLEADQE